MGKADKKDFAAFIVSQGKTNLKGFDVKAAVLASLGPRHKTGCHNDLTH